MTRTYRVTQQRSKQKIDQAIGLLLQLQHGTETDARDTIAALLTPPTRPPAALDRGTAEPSGQPHQSCQSARSLIREEWQIRARCRGMPTNIFYPSGDETRTVRLKREDAAKKLCRSCPVRSPCLQYAIETREPHGIWGATTPDERRRLTPKNAWRDPGT